ncbi:NADH-quinone oxidoreductase subunit NuoK [bacterium]|nr:NADH-quinone oxidoreductase subunit NuoK [bacterium]
MDITMYHYLFIGLVLFLMGIIGTMLVKSVVKVLILIEIMLLGVNINFVTFSTFCDGIKFDGYILSLFYIAIGAVELAVALYIFYLMYKKKQSDNIEKYNEL